MPSIAGMVLQGNNLFSRLYDAGFEVSMPSIAGMVLQEEALEQYWEDKPEVGELLAVIGCAHELLPEAETDESTLSTANWEGVSNADVLCHEALAAVRVRYGVG